MAEGGILLEELGFAMKASGAVGTSVAVVVMGGMNTETRASFQGGVEVQQDIMVSAISDARVVATATQLLQPNIMVQ